MIDPWFTVHPGESKTDEKKLIQKNFLSILLEKHLPNCPPPLKCLKCKHSSHPLNTENLISPLNPKSKYEKLIPLSAMFDYALKNVILKFSVYLTLRIKVYLSVCNMHFVTNLFHVNKSYYLIYHFTGWVKKKFTKVEFGLSA